MRLRLMTMALMVSLLFPVVSYANTGTTSGPGMNTGGTNLVTNSGFDDNLTGWNPWKPRGEPEIVIDDTVRHRGSGSLRITGMNSGDRGSVGQLVKIKGGASYTLRAWVKTENVSAPAAFIRVQFNAEGNTSQKTRNFIRVGRLEGTRDWTLLEETFEVPEGTGSLIVELFLDYASGTVWWDDVEVVPDETITAVAPAAAVECNTPVFASVPGGDRLTSPEVIGCRPIPVCS